MKRLLKTFIILILFFFFPPQLAFAQTLQNPHPLRPFPNNPVAEEKQKTFNPDDPTLTFYCAQRPTAVQTNRIDRRLDYIDLTVIGNLTTDFTDFVTPLLSITDDKKSDFDLPFENKAQTYLADYLEGRAYYEEYAEDPDDPNLQQDFNQSPYSLLQSFLPSRTGVFRNLASQTYQDLLKIALINRASGDFDSTQDNPYGFKPATETVQNYTVGHWDGQAVVGYGQGETVTLKSYLQNQALKPLRKNYQSGDDYLKAYNLWEAKDNGKWSKLWPYVPMFTREDSKGFVVAVEEPGQVNTSPTKPVEINHPHLARTYEVATSVVFLLSSQSTHIDPLDPNLDDQWFTPAPWYNPAETPWWIRSDLNKSDWKNLGAICEPLQRTIFSSGDSAYDKTLTTKVNSLKITPTHVFHISNPYYQGPPQPSCCGSKYPCEKCSECPDGHPQATAACFVNQPVRYNPIYLTTYTPYLYQIMDRLLTGPTAIYKSLKPEKINQQSTFQDENWPGLGNPDEQRIKLSFSGGSAEAGYHQDPSKSQYPYKYLGNLHCAKEEMLRIIQPFLTGQIYKPDPQCYDQALTDNLTGVCDGQAFSKLSGIPSQTTSKAQSYFLNSVLPRLTQEVTAVYKEAEIQTGVPCEVLAAIHAREGGNNANQSLVSGRPLGQPEPDAAGRVFNTLLETAIYAAELLKIKAGGQINDIQTLATALSRYNGGGNSNCNHSYSCPYAQSYSAPYCPVDKCCGPECRKICAQQNNTTTNDFVFSYPEPSYCPPSFEGQDDPYSMAWYDNQHLDMYLLFCLDNTMCTPQEYNSPGTTPMSIDYYLSH